MCAVWCYIAVNYPHTYTYTNGTLVHWHIAYHHHTFLRLFFLFNQKLAEIQCHVPQKSRITLTYKEIFLCTLLFQCHKSLINTIRYNIRWRVVFIKYVNKKKNEEQTQTHTLFFYYALMCICLFYALILVGMSIVFIM